MSVHSSTPGIDECVKIRGDAGLPCTPAQVDHHPVTVYWDSCSTHALAGIDLCKAGKPLDPTDFPTECEGFVEGIKESVVGVRRLEVTFPGGHSLPLNVLIVEGRPPGNIIIGTDTYWDYGIEINFQRAFIQWTDEQGEHQVSMEGDRRAIATNNTITANKRHAIKGMHQQFISSPVSAPNDSSILFTPDLASPMWEQGFATPACVLTVRGGCIQVPITNLGPRSKRIRPSWKIGNWTLIDPNKQVRTWQATTATKVEQTVNQIVRGTLRPTQAVVNEEQIRWGAERTQEELIWLRSVVRQYPKLFMSDDDKLKKCSKQVLTVPLKEGKGDKPILIQNRRYSPEEKKIIKEELNKMLSLGVIEKGSSPWAFPIVLVTKPDGSWRFCIDYRRLNEITVKDAYPLPRIDDALDSLGKAKVYTLVDLACGFWQVPVEMRDRLKLAFTTPFGQFLWNRMPFGVINGPATFQKMMDEVIGPLATICSMVYLDDVIIYSQNVREHLGHLIEVFDRLEQAGLTVKAKKCHVGAARINYLGFTVSETGIEPQEKTVRAIREFPVPKNADETRRFVAIANFYRRFVSGFSKIAQPLNELQKKDVIFEWTKERQEAFQELKERLIHQPVLAIPRYGDHFYVATDAASKRGIGGVLMQKDPVSKKMRPIAYCSRSFTTAEAKYSVTEQECLGCIYAMKEFRAYLYGRRFTLITDHQALRWLLSRKEQTGRIQRWLWELLEFDFEVEYIPGPQNQVADALSRAPVDPPDEEFTKIGPANEEERLQKLCARVQMMQPRNSFQITEELLIQAQEDDPVCQRIVEAGSYEGNPINISPNGLVRVVEESGRQCIFLPRSLRGQILKEYHDSPWGGHLGVTKTYLRVRNKFVAQGLKGFVHAWVGTCRDCGSRRVKPTKVIPALSPQDIGELGDRLGIDLMGPFPETEKGFAYALVTIDYATRFGFAIPMKSHKAEDVAKALINHVFAVIGPPRELMSDGAAELAKSVAAAVCEVYQTKQLHSVPYRPQYNGLVERLIRTLKDELRVFINGLQDDWDQFLGFVVLAYNVSPQATLGYAPYTLVLGREPRTPTDLMIPTKTQPTKDTKEMIDKLKRAVGTLNGEAMANYRRNTKKIEEEYNRRMKRKLWSFKEGEYCWIYRSHAGKGVGKMRCKWRGPYKIQKDVGYGNWELQDCFTHRRLITHVSFMQPFMREDQDLDQTAAACAELYADWEREVLGLLDNAKIPEDDTATIGGIEHEIIARRRYPNKSGRQELQVQVAGKVDSHGNHKWIHLSELHRLGTDPAAKL